MAAHADALWASPVLLYGAAAHLDAYADFASTQVNACTPVSSVCSSSLLSCLLPLLQKHKKEEHEKTGFMCEHGVWRCRICQPVTKHK